MRSLVFLPVLLLMIFGFAFQGCDNGSVDVDAIKQAVFRNLIEMAMTAISTEIGEFKEGRLAWMEERIEDIFGSLLEWVPDWEKKLEKAYDKVAEYGLKWLAELYPGADPPNLNIAFKPSDFDEFYNDVMEPIEDNY